MKSIFQIAKGTKTVIIMMTVLVLIGVLIAYLYYSKINKSEDPRVIQAKIKYGEYNSLVAKNDIEGVFKILDTIEQIYAVHKDYKNSYEMGVVQNNRAATWLTLAISEENDSVKKAYIGKARWYTEKGIEFYKNWLKEYNGLKKNEIKGKINLYYNPKDPIYQDLNLEDIKEKRIKDILQAQKETNRRLSVAYTNLGTICRHSDDYKNAMLYNKKALELWPENLTAKNNINILLGRPLEERSVLDKLFPEEKNLD